MKWLAVRLMVPVIATTGMAAAAFVTARSVGEAAPLVALSSIAGVGAVVYLALLALLLGGRMPRALREA